MNTSLGRLLASSLPVALTLAVACGGSSTTTSTKPAPDGGSSKTDSGTSKRDSGTTKTDSGRDAGEGLQTTYSTSCTPNIDAGGETQVMPPAVAAQQYCLVSPLPSGVTVLDSAAALAALFSSDAGSECAPPSLPAGIDFTTDSLAVFAGAGLDVESLTVYQLGPQIILQVSQSDFGAISQGEVYIVVLPTAEAKSAEVVSCTTSCSGACPG
jgi:hypothetical protein